MFGFKKYCSSINISIPNTFFVVHEKDVLTSFFINTETLASLLLPVIIYPPLLHLSLQPSWEEKYVLFYVDYSAIPTTYLHLTTPLLIYLIHCLLFYCNKGQPVEQIRSSIAEPLIPVSNARAGRSITIV